jgi:hypothetical protein
MAESRGHMSKVIAMISLKTRHVFNMFAVLALASCGGGGGSTPGPVVDGGPSPSLSWVDSATPDKPTCTDTLPSLECMLYTASNFRSDGKGGLWFLYSQKIHTMDAQYRATPTTMPANFFDVDSSTGQVWLVKPDTAGQLVVMDAAQVQTNTLVTNVSQVAAGAGATYVVQPVGTTGNANIARVSKDAKGLYQLSTLPAPPVEKTKPVFIRTDAKGQLWAAFSSFVKVPKLDGLNPDEDYSYTVTAHVFTWDSNNQWVFRGSKSYNGTSTAWSSSWTLNLGGLTPLADGSVLFSGDSAGELYKMDAAGNWTTWFARVGKSSLTLGQNGPVADIAVASAGYATEMPDGSIWFVDSETRRLYRIAAGRVEVLAGKPAATKGKAYTAKGGRILGTDSAGQLWIGNGYTDEGALLTLMKRRTDGVGMVTQGGGRFYAAECSHFYHMSTPPCAQNPVPTGKYVGVLADGRAFGVDSESSIAQVIASDETGKVSTLTSVATWPGGPYAVAGGAAPNVRLGLDDAATDGRYIYLLVSRYTDAEDKPASLQLGQSIYRINLQNGVAEIIAGNAMPSAAPKRSLDIGGDGFVSRLAVTSAGDMWLGSGSALWLLPATTGPLRKVAGGTGGTAVDGVGLAARFSKIERIRVLPDGRLLITDESAHAVRLMDASFKVSTIIGTLDEYGEPTGRLPGKLYYPVDAWSVGGRDVFVAVKNDPRLTLATRVLP